MCMHPAEHSPILESPESAAEEVYPAADLSSPQVDAQLAEHLERKLNLQEQRSEESVVPQEVADDAGLTDLQRLLKICQQSVSVAHIPGSAPSKYNQTLLRLCLQIRMSFALVLDSHPWNNGGLLKVSFYMRSPTRNQC